MTEELQSLANSGTSSTSKLNEQVRLVIDVIAGMTEQQAVEVHHRLTGISLGSVLDPVVR